MKVGKEQASGKNVGNSIQWSCYIYGKYLDREGNKVYHQKNLG
jgi:hypothetical protein